MKMPPKKKPPSKHVTKMYKPADFRPQKQQQTGSEDTVPDGEFPTLEEFQGADFAKRKIVSNWEKYDKLPDIHPEDTVSNVRDFSFLSNQSKTDGTHHFQLAAEKEWAAKKDNTFLANSLFSLDLNILSHGLACIPFHERIGLSEDELLPTTIEAFKEDSMKCGKQYKLLQPERPVTAEDQRSSSAVKSENNEEEVVVAATAKVKICDDEDDDLEDWLDSVLDK